MIEQPRSFLRSCRVMLLTAFCSSMTLADDGGLRFLERNLNNQTQHHEVVATTTTQEMAEVQTKTEHITASDQSIADQQQK